MVVRVPRVEFPSDRDHFMLSVGDVREDDELDIRDIAVFLGVIPDPITIRP
jgi:hypothetical protein